MKIAIIVQRFGDDLVGGSELHASIIADMLAEDHDITIITTCAKDYLTWDNYYEPGVSQKNNIKIIRFAVERSRDIKKFNEYSTEFFNKSRHTEQEELAWIDAQGPFVPEMIEYIKKNSDNYDIAIFYTYLYYPVVYGMKYFEKSILIPTFHREKPASLKIFSNILPKAKGYIFNTREELLAFKDYNFLKTNNYIIEGIPIDLLIERNLQNSSKNLLPSYKDRYFLYSGRIDRQKGFFDILDYHRKLIDNRVLCREKLIVTGSGELQIDDDSISYLGFVDEYQKYELIRNATAVLVPSYLESLSIIALESFYHGVPVIGRESCGPVKGHIIKGNAGLLFSDFDSYKDAIVNILSDRFFRKKLGENAKNYVQTYFNSHRIRSNYHKLFNKLT